MAITVLSEFFYEDGYDSYMVSPFMNPVLHYKVSGAGAVSAPNSEIFIGAGGDLINIEAVYEKTVSDEHYFVIDLSDVLKYILRKFGGIEKLDDLEFVNGNISSILSNYIREIYISIYFERDTVDEQLDVIRVELAYLAEQCPNNTGFNLWRIKGLSYLNDLKWTKDTYNAIMYIGYNDGTIEVNGDTIYDEDALSYAFYQYKFDKDISPLIKGRNEVTVTTIYGSRTINIDYDPDNVCAKCLCWQHPQLGYVSYPFEGAMATTTDVSAGLEVGKLLTTMVNVGQLKEQMGYKKTKRVTLWTKAESKYWPLLEELYNSRHVYLFVGASGAADTTATWLECRVSGGYSDISNRHSKVFSVELTLPEQYTISF